MSDFVDTAWRTALVVVPMAALGACVLRVLPCRPGTRHVVWVALLLAALILPFLPTAPVPDLVAMAHDRQTPPAALAGAAADDERDEDSNEAAEAAEATGAAGAVAADAVADDLATDEAAVAAPVESHDMDAIRDASEREDAAASRAAQPTSDGLTGAATSPRTVDRMDRGVSAGRGAAGDTRRGGSDARPRSDRGDVYRRSPARRTADAGVDRPMGRSLDQTFERPARAERVARPEPLVPTTASATLTVDPVSVSVSASESASTTVHDDRRAARSNRTTIDTASPASTGRVSNDVAPRDAADVLTTPSTGTSTETSTSPTTEPRAATRDAGATPVTPAPARRTADALPATSSVASEPHESPAAAETVAPAAAPAITPTGSWFQSIRRVRDAVSEVPPPPAEAWVLGALFALSLAVIRCVRFQTQIDRARPAPARIRREVAAVCRECGIDRVPEVRVTARRCSPLLWCLSRHRVLLVPEPLWAELDAEGRRAVIAHELAHLRRGDHIVCWISLVAGVLYWWHPVVWWMRRRIDEEADLSCDAWVTTLMPDARRAYATALLRTKAYAGGAPTAGHALALTNHKTRRFARRLTMVMTRSGRPTPTTGGAALAFALATGMWLVGPTLACPPEKSDTVAQAKSLPPSIAEECPPEACDEPAPAPRPGQAARAPRPSLPDAGALPTPPNPPSAPSAPAQAAAPPAGVAGWLGDGQQAEPSVPRLPRAARPSHPERVSGMAVPEPPAPPTRGLGTPRAPRTADAITPRRIGQAAGAAPRAVEASGQNGTDARLDALESRMQRIESMLERVLIHLEGGHTTAPARDAWPEAPVMMGSVGDGDGDGGRAVRVAQPEPTLRGAYRVKNGQMKDLWTLMARDDVPVFVSREGNTLTVSGPMHHQMIMEAFIAMIGDDEERDVVYAIDGGKREALYDLMARSDVPIWIKGVDEGIRVTGNDLEHLVFEAFVNAIKGDPAQQAQVADAMTLREQYEADAVAEVEGVAARRAMMDRLNVKAAAVEQLAVQLNAVQAEVADLASARAVQIQERDQLAAVAARLEASSATLEAEAASIERAADEAEGDDRVALLEKLGDVRVAAERTNAEHRVVEVRLDQVEARCDDLEAALERLEARLADLAAEREARVAQLAEIRAEERRAADRAERAGQEGRRNRLR